MLILLTIPILRTYHVTVADGLTKTEAAQAAKAALLAAQGANIPHSDAEPDWAADEGRIRAVRRVVTTEDLY